MRKIAIALASGALLAGCDMIGSEQREESGYDVTAAVVALTIRTACVPRLGVDIVGGFGV